MNNSRWATIAILLCAGMMGGRAYGQSQDDLSRAAEIAGKITPSKSLEETSADGFNAQSTLMHIKAVCAEKPGCLRVSLSPDASSPVEFAPNSYGPTNPMSNRYLGPADPLLLGNSQTESQNGGAGTPPSPSSPRLRHGGSKEKWVWFGLLAGGVAAGDYYAFKAGISNDRYNKLHPTGQQGSMTTGGAVGITIVTGIPLGLLYAHLRGFFKSKE